MWEPDLAAETVFKHFAAVAPTNKNEVKSTLQQFWKSTSIARARSCVVSMSVTAILRFLVVVVVG
jgi:hypothetical protein